MYNKFNKDHTCSLYSPRTTQVVHTCSFAHAPYCFRGISFPINLSHYDGDVANLLPLSLFIYKYFLVTFINITKKILVLPLENILTYVIFTYTHRLTHILNSCIPVAFPGTFNFYNVRKVLRRITV